MGASPDLDVEELHALAALLGAPDQDAHQVVTQLSRSHPWLGPAERALADWPLEHWQAEHTRLFINGYPHTPCPPFLSVDRHGEMFGDVTFELRALYQKAGLQPSTMPPDYLGTLLEFAAHLAALDDSQELLDEFWSDYLAPWLAHFGSTLHEAAVHPLYRVLGARLAELSHVS